MYERALRIYEKVLGPNHPRTTIALDNVVGLMRDLGEHEGDRHL